MSSRFWIWCGWSAAVLAFCSRTLADSTIASGTGGPAGGTVEGAVTFKGTVPRSPVADENGLHREMLEVDRASGGLRYVVVHLEREQPLPGKISSEEPAGLLVDQIDHTFVPHVLAVRPGQTVVFTNSDPANHNVRTSSAVRRNEFNVFTGSGGAYRHRFLASSNDAPVKLGCDIHPWMTAWIFVFEHPYFAVTDAEGRFRMEGVPAGEYTVVFRQPDIRYTRREKLRAEPGSAARVEIQVSDRDARPSP